MTWSELDGSTWTLPAARNKVKVELVRPLSRAALAIVTARPRDSEYVFTIAGKPLIGFGARKAKLDAACGVTGWTVHDLRRTARSLISRAGIRPDIAEQCLGHVIGGVRGTYDRHKYYGEKAGAFGISPA